jgi:hypothetical protein
VPLPDPLGHQELRAEGLRATSLASLLAEIERAGLGGQTLARHAARAEPANAEVVLAERRAAAITAAKPPPPPCITKELGERPSDPKLRRSWDRGVSEIERYRQENGIKDPDRALGRERGQEHDWNRDQARERLQQRQVELQRTQEQGMEREAEFSMEIGL